MHLFLTFSAAFLLLFQTCVPSTLLQGQPAVAWRPRGIQSLTALGPGSSFGYTTRRRRQCQLLPLQRRLRGGGEGGGAENDWNDDDDMSLSSISFSGSDAFGLGRTGDDEKQEAGAEYRQYIEDHEDVDWKPFLKGGSSFLPGQGDVVNIRYGKEGWHSIDVEGNETIESIISRLQPRDGSDSLPQDMLPYLSVPFELSLNDRTPLARNVTLSDHEMVPGDMLYIIKRSDAMRSSRNEEFTREELEEMGAGATMIDKESEDELSYARFVPTLLPDEPLGEPLPAANISLPKSFALDHPDGLNATVEVFDLPEVYDENGQHISSSFGPQSFESGARGAVAPPAVGRTEDGRLVSTVPIASDLDSKLSGWLSSRPGEQQIGLSDFEALWSSGRGPASWFNKQIGIDEGVPLAKVCDDLVIMALSKMNPKDIPRVECISPRLKALCSDEYLWKLLVPLPPGADRTQPPDGRGWRSSFDAANFADDAKQGPAVDLGDREVDDEDGSDSAMEWAAEQARVHTEGGASDARDFQSDPDKAEHDNSRGGAGATASSDAACRIVDPLKDWAAKSAAQGGDLMLSQESDDEREREMEDRDHLVFGATAGQRGFSAPPPPPHHRHHPGPEGPSGFHPGRRGAPRGGPPMTGWDPIGDVEGHGFETVPLAFGGDYDRLPAPPGGHPAPPISAASINIRRPTGSDQLFAPPARYPPTGMHDLEPFMVPGDPLADTGFFGSRRQSREGGFGARASFGLTSSQAFDSLDPDPLSSSARGEVDGGQSVDFSAGNRRVRPGEGNEEARRQWRPRDQEESQRTWAKGSSASVRSGTAGMSEGNPIWTRTQDDAGVRLDQVLDSDPGMRGVGWDTEEALKIRVERAMEKKRSDARRKLLGGGSEQ